MKPILVAIVMALVAAFLSIAGAYYWIDQDDAYPPHTRMHGYP